MKRKKIIVMHNCFMHADQLAALRAAVDHGSFEAGARALHITPSAMSQRIRTLEAGVGSVLVLRTLPVAVTEAGQVILRLARQIDLLETEALSRLPGRTADAESGGGAEVLALRITVNADSLATWFRPVFDAAATWTDAVLQVEIADQDQADRAVAEAQSMGATSSRARPHHGCRVTPLGVMRYVAVAVPELLERCPAGPGAPQGLHADIHRMPMVDYGPDDELQGRFLARWDAVRPQRRTLVPSSAEFLAAVEAGLGWGMLPELQLAGSTAELMPIAAAGRNHIDVPIHWHRWKMPSDVLERLETAVVDAARVLRPFEEGARRRR